MAKLLVTGAAGYLGAEVCARAAARGLAVAGTHHNTAPLGVDSVALDVRDAVAVAAAVAAAAPDAIIHTAYRQDGAEAAAVNTAGAEHVARAAARAGARLVHLSTDVVFAGTAGRPLREDDRPAPVTAYGQTKAAAEAAVLAAHPAAVLVRTSLIYGGPDGPASGHEALAVAAAQGRRPDVAFYTDELRCPVQVGDLAAAVLELVALPVAGPLHVAGADGLSRLELATLVARCAGEDAGALAGRPAPPARPRDCRLDSSRAQALLRTRLRGARAVLAAPDVGR